MSLFCAFVGATFALPPPVARVDIPVVEAPKRQLRGITHQEAEKLIATLQDAQRRLRSGDDQLVFELLSGSLACYDMTKLSARDAFLKMPFDQAWDIERLADEGVTTRFRLAYAPHGLGQLYWEIEVTIGFNDRIWRVMLLYKPPAPF